jgi:hypothetical protein
MKNNNNNNNHKHGPEPQQEEVARGSFNWKYTDVKNKS